ncbi:MAG: class I SAM-dependent methyltransferase, partial [Spirochaetes bacterium]|nr:class I SAM-dependent methyltransferase [Spirochaetota bacterium]
MKKSLIPAAVFVILSLAGLVFVAGLVSCDKADRNFSPVEYDKKFRARYSRAFPVLARDILRQAKVDRGICVDMGCGPGYLGLAIAKNSAMTVHSLDILPEMIGLVKKYSAEEKLAHRVHPVVGDVHNLPYGDGFADLVVSRGSLPFWRDKRKA